METRIRPNGEDIGFQRILFSEIEAINKRRDVLGRPPVRANPDALPAMFETIGLALSGGGIRAAAFSLGVLQSLNRHGILHNIDYLSTVSGGGYIGGSLTATMTKSGGSFVFGDNLLHRTDASRIVEVGDSAAVGHLRNYSNYLLPPGGRYFGELVMTILRGVVPNLGLLLAILLTFAAFTIWSNPNRSSLECTSVFGALCPHIQIFGVTLIIAALFIALVLGSAIVRSLSRRRPERGSFVATVFMIVLAAAFFSEFQSFAIDGMFAGSPNSRITSSIKLLAGITLPIAVIVIVYSAKLGDLVTAGVSTGYPGPRLFAFVAQGAIWTAAAAVPLSIWVIYLYLSYWGIIDDYPNLVLQSGHTPNWLLVLDNFVMHFLKLLHIPITTLQTVRPLIGLYLTAALFLVVLSSLIRPNANSLHGIYRDRLKQAFLFDPTRTADGRNENDFDVSFEQTREFPPLALRLSELSVAHAPYHLIGASLNIQGSVHANRRARNADFFLFSPLYVGSYVTGWAPTAEFETMAPDVDLATAMAISGAAVSANMQATPLRAMTPTLALLNISLGYWLKNPKYWQPNASSDWRIWHGLSRLLVNRLTVSLWSQMTGRLQENSTEIYVTDGGHLENLGVYELLRRRCRVIIVVDAEADPKMYFDSFVRVLRFARIDLGIHIEMSKRPIQISTVEWMGYDPIHEPVKRMTATAGPHVMIGSINYGADARGFLVYIKSSLTGDEPDYVRDYARRHRKFPHEDTGNQFFNEEQFEVYRALGAHVGYRFFSGLDEVEVVGAPPGSHLTFADPSNTLIGEVRNALGVPPT